MIVRLPRASSGSQCVSDMTAALYLSAPGVVLPDGKCTNEDQLAKVREQFRGSESQFEFECQAKPQ